MLADHPWSVTTLLEQRTVPLVEIKAHKMHIYPHIVNIEVFIEVFQSDYKYKKTLSKVNINFL